MDIGIVQGKCMARRVRVDFTRVSWHHGMCIYIVIIVIPCRLGIIESSFYFVLYEYVKYRVAHERYQKEESTSVDFTHYQRLHAFTSVDYIVMSAACKSVAASVTYPHEGI